MKRFIIVFLIAVLCSVSLGTQSNLKISALQFLGGLAGEGCCFAPAYFLLEYGDWENPLILFSVAGLCLVSPLASARGVRLVGNHYYNEPERGSYGYSILGAYIGGITLVSFLVATKVTENCDWYVAPILAIPPIGIGAVLGYQLSRHKTAQHSFLNDHLQSPSLGLKLKKDEKGKRISALDIRLLNARF
jgi:hypothetical protein